MSIQPFTPGLTAVVTAAVGAASISLPTAVSGKGYQVQIQVAAGANAAFGFTGAAVAPDGTPTVNRYTILGGNSSTITLPGSCTAISYIRVGGTDATVYFSFGLGE